MVVVSWYVLLCNLLIDIKILQELTYPLLAGCMLLHSCSYFQISRIVNLPDISNKFFSALLWLTSCRSVTSNTRSGYTEIADLPVAHSSWLIDRCLISFVTEVYVHRTTLVSVHRTTLVYVHRTTLVSVHLTTLVSVHHTTLVYVHRTTLVSVHLTTLVYVHRTTLVTSHSSENYYLNVFSP